MARFRQLLLGCALIACACDESAAPATGVLAHGDDVLGGEVVATVDGVAVRRADVAELVAGSDLSPTEALRRLEDEVLLAREAERRGYGERGEVRRVSDRLAVQVLLADIERELGPEAMPPSEVRAAFDRSNDPTREEARRGHHVVIRVPPEIPRGGEVDEAARQHAVAALTEMAYADRPEGFAGWDARTSVDAAGTTLDVFADRLPLLPFGAERQLGRVFRDAYFAGEGVGPLDAPVRTDAGWHAVVVDEIRPALQGFAAWEAEIRRQGAGQARLSRLASTVEGLREELGVEESPSGVERALRIELEGPRDGS